MKSFRMWILAFGGLALIGAIVLYVRIVVLHLAPIPGAEISETKMELRNVAGADFEVVETDYDGFSKEEFVSVYVWKAGRRSNWMGQLAHRKDLLFRYDPSWDESIPIIEATGPNSIRISVERVS